MTNFFKATFGVAVVVITHMVMGLLAQLAGLVFVVLPLIGLAALCYFFT